MHGRRLLAPAEPVLHVARAYRENTLVLDTTFEIATGCVTLTDCMPISEPSPDAYGPMPARHAPRVRSSVRPS
jgi:hypothetical protein